MVLPQTAVMAVILRFTHPKSISGKPDILCGLPFTNKEPPCPSLQGRGVYIGVLKFDRYA